MSRERRIGWGGGGQAVNENAGVRKRGGERDEWSEEELGRGRRANGWEERKEGGDT